MVRLLRRRQLYHWQRRLGKILLRAHDVRGFASAAARKVKRDMNRLLRRLEVHQVMNMVLRRLDQ
jgi:hypothetical protein